MDSERNIVKFKNDIVSKRLRSRDMVVSYLAVSPAVRHFGEERPPKWRNDGDGSGTRPEIWRENSEKANMRLILFPRTTKSRGVIERCGRTESRGAESSVLLWRCEPSVQRLVVDRQIRFATRSTR